MIEVARNFGYRVSRYELDLDYRVSSHRLAGAATITARVEPGSSVVVTGLGGVGLGYRDVENQAMGQDPRQRAGRLTEALEVIERAAAVRGNQELDAALGLRRQLVEAFVRFTRRRRGRGRRGARRR
mgnify:CR=1 FL=1